MTYPDAPRAAWMTQGISLPTRMAASGFCNFATSSLNSAGTSSGGLAGAAAMTSYLGVGGWVFTQIGFQEPRAKLEPKWHMPLWSSISNTVHVSTCVSTLTKNQPNSQFCWLSPSNLGCCGPLRKKLLCGFNGKPSASQKVKVQRSNHCRNLDSVLCTHFALPERLVMLGWA